MSPVKMNQAMAQSMAKRMAMTSGMAKARLSAYQQQQWSEGEQQRRGVAHGGDVPALAQGEEGDEEFEVKVAGDEQHLEDECGHPELVNLAHASGHADVGKRGDHEEVETEPEVLGVIALGPEEGDQEEGHHNLEAAVDEGRKTLEEHGVTPELEVVAQVAAGAEEEGAMGEEAGIRVDAEWLVGGCAMARTKWLVASTGRLSG